ncbi:lipid A biosynthesis lauroyl acyltransferase [Endozoicomonas sp. OPT23]|uniref:LpxL/LpxP family Kdo(2)-lipid IV(A) lauroyl/palmitoleoyl acyltransferase n=1 Tax=Endozoicomonas sp. OPT23 TaxID=2072845 RepID=UPI00129A1F95|nr:LpxL/LpxP family Kdo(2)-lipid IV(A) lauroyl/palmitoleoyl acyltransferase [Endozoicomonas sp. OPT23]MRI34608.1 lipid A biosynthesis lauroyl acyltransferase [Endozoicomonas sp. OPT23]
MSTPVSNTTEADQFHWQFVQPKYWLTWLGLGFTALVSLLPYSALRLLGKGLGRLLLKFGGSRVRIARTNLEKCYPELSENERQQLLEKNFESTAMGLVEVLMAWWWPRSRLEKLVTYKGLGHLKSDSGQGNLLLILHFTTIEIAGALITMKHSVDATYREHKNPVFEYMQRRQRLRYDSGSCLLGRRDIRGMLRSMRQGKTVWYSPDQDYGPKQSVFAPFFGIETASVTGTSRMAKMGRARVVPMTVTRRDDGKGYVLEVMSSWDDFPVGDDLQDATRVNQFVEAQVRKNPDQYMWLHRRFKTRPEGESGFY